MWIIIIIIIFVTFSLLVLALLWFLIGAIINPNAYLPYAAASATFITVISSFLTKI